MRAMILAAGLGTRLRPLTTTCPKALITVAGKTLLARAIEKLAAAGIREIIVNVHHHGGLIMDFLRENPYPGLRIEISDERDMLLDSGGAILKARPFLEKEDAFLVYNVDILTDLSLEEVIRMHSADHALATLVVRDRPSTRYFLFSPDLELAGWRHEEKKIQRLSRPAGKEGLQKLAFSGIHVISSDIFKKFTEEGCFSITDTYIRLSEEHLIRAYLHKGGYWMDLGRPANLKAAETLLSHKQGTNGSIS